MQYYDVKSVSSDYESAIDDTCSIYPEGFFLWGFFAGVFFEKDGD